jgi:hypothetical protein
MNWVLLSFLVSLAAAVSAYSNGEQALTSICYPERLKIRILHAPLCMGLGFGNLTGWKERPIKGGLAASFRRVSRLIAWILEALDG